MRRKLAELRLFFREFRRNFHRTGSIAPSSPFLAKALARFVTPAEGPRNILEVGPGTGAVTREIVRRLGKEDRLDLVELNESFVAALEERFRNEPEFAAVADRAKVYHLPVEDLPHRAHYDLVISGLPLNNFAVDDVARILATFSELAKPGGTLSFFEYIAVRPMRSAFAPAAERQRLRGIGRLLRELLSEGEFRCDRVLTNLPPAWVHHVRLGNEANVQ